MSRWLSPLMAFCLSFLLITTLAPVVGIQKDRQLDFWALWLVLMVVLALPFAYLEVALVKRAKTTALQALMSLNPMYQFLTATRTVVVYEQMPTLKTLGIITLFGVGMLLIGSYVFRKKQDKFIYYI